MQASKWTTKEVADLFALPFLDLLVKAQSVHKQYFTDSEIELCHILSIKTGTCPENCAYCTQSGHYQTDVQRENLLSLEEVLSKAKHAKESGVTRFCMGAAWRSPPKKDLPKVVAMIKAVKALGLETCVTLGMLDDEQVTELKMAGLDFYNHNIDTSPTYYEKIITTHTFADRINTLEKVRAAGINVCCGGILGLGESREDRIEFLIQLANMPEPPKSVPINRLIPMKGTPLQDNEKIEPFEFVRTIAAARIMMPQSMVRLSGERLTMSEEMQALCFMAGANSMWLGEKLLTAQSHKESKDLAMLHKLGLKPKVNTAHDASA